MEAKELTLKILNQIREHYMNTTLIDSTDEEALKEVDVAINWVKEQQKNL